MYTFVQQRGGGVGHKSMYKCAYMYVHLSLSPSPPPPPEGVSVVRDKRGDDQCGGLSDVRSEMSDEAVHS